MEMGQQVFVSCTNSVGMDNKTETLEFIVTLLMGVCIQFHTQPLHLTWVRLQESCLFVQMPLF